MKIIRKHLYSIYFQYGKIMEGTERTQSEFNMAVAWLNRLNEFFYISDRAHYELKAYEWLHALMILYNELSSRIKKEEIIFWDSKTKELLSNVNRLNIINNRTGRISIDNKLYWDLIQFERFLHKIMDESGLLTKSKDDPRFAFK